MSTTERYATRIDASPVLAAPETVAVIDALARDGAEVRFVGGCVRDLLLGRGIEGDIDFATTSRPETVKALLGSGGIEAVPTGLDHGTVTALAGGRRFEITTLRVDVRTDGRHADVAFTGDWQADARRRDLTINAMSLRPDGMLFDYFGGREDLEAGRVRFVGDAGERIAEDHLRVLRYFRFVARFGRGTPDPEALAACAEARHLLGLLAAERVQSELVRLLAVPDPVPALKLMASTGVLAEVLPEAGPLGVLAALAGIDDRDPLRRLAALAPGGGRSIASRLRLSRASGRRLEALSPPAVRLEPGLSASRQRELLYDLGPDLVRDLVLLAWASDSGAHAGRWRAMLETAGSWVRPVFPIRGQDAVDAGVAPGPLVAEIVAQVEQWWRGEDFRPGREACLARLRETVAAAR